MATRWPQRWLTTVSDDMVNFSDERCDYYLLHLTTRGMTKIRCRQSWRHWMNTFDDPCDDLVMTLTIFLTTSDNSIWRYLSPKSKVACLDGCSAKMPSAYKIFGRCTQVEVNEPSSGKKRYQCYVLIPMYDFYGCHRSCTKYRVYGTICTMYWADMGSVTSGTGIFQIEYHNHKKEGREKVPFLKVINWTFLRNM